VRLIERTVQLLLLIKETPRRTALAFSLGVFLGFSPFIGLHTLLGLLLAYLFRLNKVGVLVGVYTNVPWLAVPYYGFATWFGIQVTGFSQSASIPHVGFRQVFELEFWREFSRQLNLLIPAAVGSLILALLIAVVAYWFSFHALTRFAASQPAGPEQDQ
jgi:uncharacterized protein (DUF2062 family)